MNDQPKLCINCRHCIPPIEGLPMDYAKCRRATLKSSLTYITGESTAYRYCQVEREATHDEMFCGPKGRWFECPTAIKSRDMSTWNKFHPTPKLRHNAKPSETAKKPASMPH